MTAKTSTMTVEIIVSRRDGHVTFAVSDLTCCRKVKGFTVFDAIRRSVVENPLHRVFWMIPLPGDVVSDQTADAVSLMQFGRVKQVSQLHAPRVRPVYIKPIPCTCKCKEPALSQAPA